MRAEKCATDPGGPLHVARLRGKLRRIVSELDVVPPHACFICDRAIENIVKHEESEVAVRRISCHLVKS